MKQRSFVGKHTQRSSRMSGTHIYVTAYELRITKTKNNASELLGHLEQNLHYASTAYAKYCLILLC